MSAADPTPAPHPAPSAVQQARLAHLFRHHLRDDPANAATHALRRAVESYRLEPAAKMDRQP